MTILQTQVLTLKAAFWASEGDKNKRVSYISVINKTNSVINSVGQNGALYHLLNTLFAANLFRIIEITNSLAYITIQHESRDLYHLEPFQL